MHVLSANFEGRQFIINFGIVLYLFAIKGVSKALKTAESIPYCFVAGALWNTYS